MNVSPYPHRRDTFLSAKEPAAPTQDGALHPNWTKFTDRTLSREYLARISSSVCATRPRSHAMVKRQGATILLWTRACSVEVEAGFPKRTGDNTGNLEQIPVQPNRELL
jgi:hypothetical protein